MTESHTVFSTLSVIQQLYAYTSHLSTKNKVCRLYTYNAELNSVMVMYETNSHKHFTYKTMHSS